MRKQLVTILASLTAMTAASAFAVVAPHAAPAEAATCTSGLTVPNFDGAGGTRADLAIGIPGEDVPGAADAGVVEIRYPDGTVGLQGLTAPDYRTGDRFGTAVLASDLNSDACTDLLVGAPGRDVGGLADAGAVYVFLGSPTGLAWSQTLTMGSGGIAGPAQAGARFGEVLGAFNTIAGGYGPFLAGLPRYDVGTATDAGAVLEFWLDGSHELITQNTTGVADVAEAGDRFGAAVQGHVWEGDDRSFRTSAPLEDVGSVKDAGAVFDCSGSTTALPDCTVLTQDSPNVPGGVEAGDRFGATLTEQFVGVPGEDIRTAVDAGMVETTTGIAISQDTEGVAGAPESGDQFGAALALYRPSYTGADHYILQIGVPGEDISGRADAGMVGTALVPFNGGAVRGAGGLSADPTAGTVQAGDRYGASLGVYEIEEPNPTRRWPQWAIGSPGDGSGAGEAIIAETNNVDGSLVTSEAWKQIAGAPEAGDGYGSEVSSLP